MKRLNKPISLFWLLTVSLSVMPTWILKAETNTKPNVVINEVAYFPEMSGPIRDPLNPNIWLELEYIELLNASAENIELFNPHGSWRLDGGVHFAFATNTMMGPGSRLVLINFDPADTNLISAFREAYALEDRVVTFLGPYIGRMNNRSDRIALEKPQAGANPDDPLSWAIIDEVIYSTEPPWPEGPNGFHLSLQRLSANLSGNDPANWGETNPSPGWAWPDTPLRMEPISKPDHGLLTLRARGDAGKRYKLEASTNLRAWSAINTNYARNGEVYFYIQCDTNAPYQYYRTALMP